MRKWWLALVLLLAACEPNAVIVITPTPIPSLDTTWGRSQALTWAPVFDFPALSVDNNTPLLGAFERYEGVPTLVIYRDGVRARSNITGLRPYALSIFPAQDNSTVALWLDEDGSGVQKIYTAFLRENGFSERGTIAVSSGAATRYASAALPDKSYWVVWSSPITGESALIGSRIDSSGRPRASQPLRADADFPALAVTNTGNALLYWLEGSRLDLYGGEITDAGLTQVTEISAAPWPRQRADHLIRLDAGLDTDTAYIFWQVRNGLGLTEVWLLAAPLDTVAAKPAQRITVTLTSDLGQTGFNHGTAYVAAQDLAGQQVSWALPAHGQNETLPVAAVIDGKLGVLYLQRQTIAAGQILATLGGELIAPPRVAITNQRDLVVTWWAPDTPEEAILYVTDSRR